MNQANITLTGPAEQSNARTTYERLRPLITWLGLTELAWIAWWLFSVDVTTPTYVATVVVWVVAMLGWLAFVIRAGGRGLFLKHTRRLSNLLGVALVVSFATALFWIVPGAWDGLLLAARGTTVVQLASIHILRLLAIGSFIKYRQGELPLHFVIWGTVPDLLFALSAVVVTALAAGASLDPSFLEIWHLVGFSAFFGAGVAMYFTVPSLLRIFESKPDTSIVFKFPMVLAPNFTVPLFMIAHLFALLKLLG